jgi:TusA-related sulfurtransferase
MASSKKKIIDARGLFCPGPIQVLKGVIKNIENGTLIELLADDPDAKQDVKEWCETTGNTLISIDEKDETLTFLIKKTQPT